LKRRGQGMTEISMLLAVVAIAAIIILTLFGGKVGSLFQCVVKDLQGQACTASDAASASPFAPGGAYAGAVEADSPTAYWRLDDSGTVIADAVGGHNGTLAGTAAEGVPGALDGGSDKAIIFNGSNTSVSAPVGALGPTWTLEAWAKTNTLAEMHIVEATPVQFYVTTTGNLVAKVQGVGSVTTVVSSPGLADGNWHYVVATDDGSNVNLYVDGQLRATTTTFGGAASITGTTVSIGQAVAGGSYFNGILDEVAVYGTALGADRVAAHFLAASS